MASPTSGITSGKAATAEGLHVIPAPQNTVPSGISPPFSDSVNQQNPSPALRVATALSAASDTPVVTIGSEDQNMKAEKTMEVARAQLVVPSTRAHLVLPSTRAHLAVPIISSIDLQKDFDLSAALVARAQREVSALSAASATPVIKKVTPAQFVGSRVLPATPIKTDRLSTPSKPVVRLIVDPKIPRRTSAPNNARFSSKDDIQNVLIRRRPSTTELTLLPGESRKERFEALANQIYSDKSRQTVLDIALQSYMSRDGRIEKIELATLLECFEEFFPGVLEARARKMSSEFYLVLGGTGVGISLFIGYLKGCDIEKREISIVGVEGSTQTVRIFKNADLKGYPVLGHEGGSKTKGAMVYPPYIDTGGSMSTQGPEGDICNAAAINIATRKYSPSRLIIVIPPGDLVNNRCQSLFDYLDKLQGYIPALGMPIDGPSLMSSIYFVVNDKDDLYTERHVFNAIDKAIGELTIEQNEIVELTQEEKEAVAEWAQKLKDSAPPVSSVETTAAAQVQQYFNLPILKYLRPRQPSTSAVSSVSIETNNTPPGLEKLVELEKDKSKYEKWLDLQAKINMLTLMRWERNILVVNFDNGETRDRINAWLADPSKGRLSRENFNIRDPDKEERIKGVLSAVASYFIERFDENKRYKTQELEEIIDKLYAAPTFQSGVGEISSENIEKYKQVKAQFEQMLQEKETRLNQLERQKSDKSEEQNRLSRSNNPVLFKTLQPINGPIVPRSFWRFPAFAYDYKFRCTAPGPIVRVDKCMPKANQGSSYPGGQFINEVADYSNGKYEIEYKSAYFGFVEDSKVTVEIYVQEKNHPATQLRIGELTTEVENLERESRELRLAIIPGIKAIIASCEGRIVQGTSKIKGQQSGDHFFEIDEVEQEPLEEQLKKQLTDSKLEQAKIQRELNYFKKFCDLMKGIIIELNLLSGAREDDPNTQAFARFMAREELFSRVTDMGTEV